MPNKKANFTVSSELKQAIHDLNNIFTSTLASSEILEKLCKNNTKISKYTQTIKTNSLQAIDIINAMTNNRTKIKKSIAIIDIVSKLKMTLKPTLPKGVKLQFQLAKNLKKVDANYSDLYRAFLNLLINAIESITAFGTIVFSAKNKNDQIIISIKDSGKGISKGKLKNIFDEGFSLKKDKLNAGLGLTIVKKIIENHKGSIDVSSKLNVGTEFIITLPAIINSEVKKYKKQTHKILLADDDKIILELFSDLLSTYNYDITTAFNGKMAITEFNNNKFDLIIIDKIMPFLDGLECISLIRKTNSTIPIILTTGSQETIDKEYPDLKIAKKMKKPWSFEDMLKTIQNLIG